MKKFFAKRLTNYVVKKVDYYVLSRYSTPQILGGVTGITLIASSPSIFAYVKENTKLMAHRSIKPYFGSEAYQNTVRDLKQEFSDFGIGSAGGAPDLSEQDKALIYGSFLALIEADLQNLTEEMDLELVDLLDNEDAFGKRFLDFDSRKTALTRSLLNYFMIDVGLPQKVRKELNREIELDGYLRFLYSATYANGYSERLSATRCDLPDVRNAKFTIESSTKFGKKNMFPRIKNANRKELALQNYFMYDYYKKEGTLLEICLHLREMKAFLKNSIRVLEAEQRLERDIKRFLDNKLDEKTQSRGPGRRLRLDSVIDEKSDKFEKKKRSNKLRQRRKHESKQEWEMRRQRREQRLKEEEDDFNREFLHSEYGVEKMEKLDVEEGIEGLGKPKDESVEVAE